MKNQKKQETENQRDWRLSLLAAQFLWDLEEAGVAGDDPTLTFTWKGDWYRYSGEFLQVRRLIQRCVTVSWRYERPPKRPSEDLVWDGKSWSSQRAETSDEGTSTVSTGTMYTKPPSGDS